MFDKQTKKFCSAVVDALPDVPEEVMQGWVENPRGLTKVLKAALCPTGEIDQPKPTTFFPLTINPTLTPEQRITAGHYDWWNRDLLKWFREDQSLYSGADPVSVRAELLHLDCEISTPHALAAINKLGYRPATIEELTALGEQHPEVQRQFPIVALGSVFVGPPDGRRSSPYLDGDDARRGLGLHWHDDGWSACCRFAVVRNGDWES